MSKDNNFVRIRGKVLRNEDERPVRAGLKIIDFALVVDDPDGERPVYVDCYGTNDTCNALDGFVEEGDELAIEGHLTFRTFTTRNGQRRSGMVVYVERVTF